MRILIAEDEVATRLALAELLRKQGYEVLTASDGIEALEALRQADAPPLALIDWLMPHLDGAEVIRAVRASGSKRPPYLIMLTIRGEKTDVVRGLAAGANDYVSKPFDPHELCARVEVGRRMLDLQNELADKVDALQEALEQIRTLRGILPICAKCKKIRDDQGYWEQLEVYIRSRTDAEFTHSICPQCEAQLFEDTACQEAPPQESQYRKGCQP